MSSLEWGATAVVAGAAAACIALERARPYNPGQPLLREGFWTDFVFYTVVQSFVLGLLIGRLIAWLDAHTGWSALGLMRRWPIALQLAFFIVTHDLYIYFFHRLQHRSKLLWRLHEAHHSVRHVDWLAAARSHALEILINQTIEFAPMVLLGAAPMVPLLKGTIGAVWGMFIHANLDVRLGRLQYVINGPEMHRWHHADQPEAYDTNFATKLAIWDWMFGTAYLPDPRRRKAERFGLSEPGFPEGTLLAYLQQQAHAFRPFSHEADAEPISAAAGDAERAAGP